MYYFLSLFTGALTAIMIISNGKLNAVYGLYPAIVIIHLLGLCTISIFLIALKNNPFSKRFPLFLSLGGIIGIATTIMNNLVFGQLSLSSIVALGLLGQSVTSLFIDQFGLFHRQKNPIRPLQIVGLFIIFIGIFIMIKDFKIVPMLISVAIGCSLVLSRILNAKLTLVTNTMISTFYNYFTGFCGSFLIFLFLGGRKSQIELPNVSFHLFLYLGAILSVLVVFLASYLMNQIPTFFVTLFSFIGQLFMGMIWDFIATHHFSYVSLAGGVLVSVGFCMYLFYQSRTAHHDTAKA